MCFVDTPGLGSVFSGNTAATHAFLPHIDAAMVVIGADPPIAGDELALLESVAKDVPDILLVLNKADRVTDDERQAAVSFAREILEERLGRSIPPIFEISALRQLEGGGSQPDWAGLVNSLEQLVQRSGRQMVQDAADRSLRRLSAQLLTVLKEEHDALVLPFEESERRIRQLREVVARAEQSLKDLGFLLAGEQQRLSRTFQNRREGFLNSVRAKAHQELEPRSTLCHVPVVRIIGERCCVPRRTLPVVMPCPGWKQKSNTLRKPIARSLPGSRPWRMISWRGRATLSGQARPICRKSWKSSRDSAPSRSFASTPTRDSPCPHPHCGISPTWPSDWCTLTSGSSLTPMSFSISC